MATQHMTDLPSFACARQRANSAAIDAQRRRQSSARRATCRPSRSRRQRTSQETLRANETWQGDEVAPSELRCWPPRGWPRSGSCRPSRGRQCGRVARWARGRSVGRRRRRRSSTTTTATAAPRRRRTSTRMSVRRPRPLAPGSDGLSAAEARRAGEPGGSGRGRLLLERVAQARARVRRRADRLGRRADRGRRRALRAAGRGQAPAVAHARHGVPHAAAQGVGAARGRHARRCDCAVDGADAQPHRARLPGRRGSARPQPSPDRARQARHLGGHLLHRSQRRCVEARVVLAHRSGVLPGTSADLSNLVVSIEQPWSGRPRKASGDEGEKDEGGDEKADDE